MNHVTTWIVVPSYWTFPSGEPGAELTVFDHPTPLDEEGTLVRTLQSFVNLDGDFHVLVVAACSNPVLGAQTRQRVEQLISPLAADLSLFLVAPPDVERMNPLLAEPILSLTSYGNIRNVQLLVPYAAGAEVEIGIDDDEVIEDPTYVHKALEFTGREHKGEVVAGMAGPYYDREGEFRLEGAEALVRYGNVFIMKNYYMNEALKGVLAEPGPEPIVKSNVAFGGNMTVARDTIARTCHDPYIPRGEDYDFVINAAMRKLWFYTRPDMGIVHLPPDSTGSQAADKLSKMLADIRRFIYMREKDRYHREQFPEEAIPMDYLLPYPGAYLEEGMDLRRLGVEALDTLYPRYREEHSPEAFVAEALETAKVKAAEFFAYREKWERVLADPDLTDKLAEEIERLRVR